MIERKLINHRNLAKMLDTSPANIRRWIREQKWPLPHSEVGATLWYRMSDVNHYVDKGYWPPRMAG